MTEAELQHVLDELDQVIEETRDTLARFEATGMDEQMPEDYQKLHDIYTRAVNDQRAHTLAMLEQGRNKARPE